MPFTFHKTYHSKPSTTGPAIESPAIQKPIDEETPITALRITLRGTCEKTTTSYFQTAPATQIGTYKYHIPPILTERAKDEPRRPIRGSIFEFGRNDISMGGRREQQAFVGVYCIWYEEIDRPKTAEEFEEADGEFWVFRQLQWKPEVGETIEYEDVPEGMELGTDEWWFKGVLLPRMNWLMKWLGSGDALSRGSGIVSLQAC